MKLRPLFAVLALALCSTVFSQTRKPFQPAVKQAPGAAPNKVWLNPGTKVYHCPGDRYYGRTKTGQYTTEREAKAAGARGVKGETCFK
jgi:hypothetical protein